MFQNEFVRRYKGIPIARYAHVARRVELPDMLTTPQLHKEFELLLITQGRVRVSIDDRSYLAVEGDLLFIGPYMLHSLEIPPQEVFSHICFCFDLELLSHKALAGDLAAGRYQITGHIPVDSPHNAPLRGIFTAIDSAYDREPPYWELTVRGELCRMFAWLMQNGLYESPFAQSRDKDFCIRVYRHIEEHYREKLDSAVAAEALNYNQSYFCRLFKRNFLMTFSDYLNMYRLEKAKSLLSDPARSVSGIAAEVGFSNVSYFTKLFRLQNGQSPQSFRKDICNLF